MEPEPAALSSVNVVLLSAGRFLRESGGRNPPFRGIYPAHSRPANDVQYPAITNGAPPLGYYTP